MPFSIRRFTLQRSLSGNERCRSKAAVDMVGAGRSIKKSASQDEGRSGQGRVLTASRSADHGDLSRLEAPSLREPPLQQQQQQQQLPALPPRCPQRASSVDRATPSTSASLLARWRHAGRSKSASISEPREYPLDDGNALGRSLRPRTPGEHRAALKVF
ncbi:hypothetical protein IscW_ISCW003719 [Ixodes scapularis]|uniref:Uncharacterized protein n=1 Tax=Ixodes scapularis TaxID=6945 RepID=B7PI75_IXOSC|nr:hypothetical protein IscW_ISCW003719 [Ixodes scapularis]|eukprot:XP_002404514.1 hypothetical protein IscW_ISCW003719 [Ixodes scapularis]